jgi:dinuclear metal center YbgI/SA1388 family protein
MLLRELIAVIEELAPTRFAESWDNVGLLVGDPSRPIASVLFTIDYTAAVAAEARERRCDCVISYHPPIFEALKRITAPSLVFDAIRDGVAIYSPHTALDVADGGTNDMLADALGLKDRQPLRPAKVSPAHCKLVVFTPPNAVDKVAQAIFSAGAGWIGNYSSCSFQTPGIGTFFGQPGASPTVGQPGRLERVDEIRLESLVPLTKIDAVLHAMRAAHPYEEPAFDLLALHSSPDGRGMGRIGAFAQGTDRATVIDRIKRELDLPHLLIAGPTTGPAARGACCAGACGELLNDALAQNTDLYLTGEMRHHDALKGAARGMTVICTLHSNSERKVLARLSTRISEKLPDLAVHLSRADRDPFQIV